VQEKAECNPLRVLFVRTYGENVDNVDMLYIIRKKLQFIQELMAAASVFTLNQIRLASRKKLLRLCTDKM